MTEPRPSGSGRRRLHFHHVLLAIIAALLIFESLVTYSLDVVIGNCRVFPLDILTVGLLVFGAGWRRGGRRLPSAAIGAVAVALLVPAAWGYAHGNDVRGIARDLRCVGQFLTVLPLARLIDSPENWARFKTYLVVGASIAAYLLILGLLTGRRLQQVPGSWATAAAGSGEVSRGYGVVSSYFYIGLAAFLEASTERAGLARRVNCCVLTAALFATFVRGYILTYFVALATWSVLTAIGARRGTLTTALRPWIPVTGCIGILTAAAGGSEYARVMLDRAASIVDAERGGAAGIATYNFRVKGFERAVARAGEFPANLLGYGYGDGEGIGPDDIAYYNHNGYAWLLERGGLLAAAAAIGSILILAVSVYRRPDLRRSERTICCALIAGELAGTASFGHLFNSYQPTGMFIVAVFVAGTCAAGAARFRPRAS